MKTESATTHWVRIYLSGPIEVAKQIIRREVKREGLCVTIESTTFMYTGGEETGYVVGLINYPRFPATAEYIWERAMRLAIALLEETYQHSALCMAPDKTEWLTTRQDSAA